MCSAGAVASGLRQCSTSHVFGTVEYVMLYFLLLTACFALSRSLGSYRLLCAVLLRRCWLLCQTLVSPEYLYSSHSHVISDLVTTVPGSFLPLDLILVTCVAVSGYNQWRCLQLAGHGHLFFSCINFTVY